MKIIVIGDIHGHDSWKKIIAHEQTFDKVVFLGDYWDSFRMSPKQQEQNYLDICEFRESNPDKVITLLGNHDFHYIYPAQYSGWKSSTRYLATPLLEKDIRENKLPFVYKHEDILFSHAGITNYWMNNVANCLLEDLLEGKVQLKLFDWNGKLGMDPYGDTISNSPIWVRPHSLKCDFLDGYRQVVGHTHRSTIQWKFIDTLYFFDSLPKEYLVIQDGEFVCKALDYQ